MTFPTERPLALAVVAVLEAELGAGRVGYGERPASGGWQVTGTPAPEDAFNGYAVVWPGGSTPHEGTVAQPNRDAAQLFTVISVGKRAVQADAIRDRCRVALLTPGALTVPGRLVDRVDGPIGGPTSVDRDVSPPLWSGSDVFTAYTTTA